MIDLTRYQKLLDALAGVRESGPSFAVFQTAQSKLAQAHSDLADFKSRPPLGQRDARNPDLVAMHERDMAEMEKRVADARHEVERIEAAQRERSDKLAVLEQLVTGIRAWGANQDPPVELPGGDAGVRMPGFGATLHIQQPPQARAFDIPSAQLPSRQGGFSAAAERPAQLTHIGSAAGIVGMLRRHL